MKKKKENIENQDPNLEKIRHYRGTWDNFFDFWKSKGVEVDPYKGTLLKYPTEKIYKGRENVHQDFDTYKKSKTLKENMKHIKTFDDFVNESETINERYNKKSLLKKLGSADDATIQTGNGKEYIIYNPNNNNDDNTAMWGDKTIFALDQDGGEHEIAYKDIGLVMVESAVNEAENYITNEYKVGDKIKTDFGEWKVIETDYKPGKSFIAPFIFTGKDMERANIPNPPKTNKKAVGYKVTDGDKYPITGFLYQYKGKLGSKSFVITKLATVGIDESVNEAKDKVDVASLSIGNTYKDNKGYPVKVIDIKGTGNRWKVTYQHEDGKKKTVSTSLDKGINLYESVNEGSDQARLTHLRKFGIAPNNQPQNAAYIKQVSKPGKFFVDWKDAFKLGDVALEFIKSSGSESVFDIIDLKTMKRTGKQLDVKKGDLGNLRTTYGVRVNESVNEAIFKEGQSIKSKNDSNKFDGDVYDVTNDVDGTSIPKNSSFEIQEIGKDEVILYNVQDDIKYSIDPDDLKKHFVKESTSVNEMDSYAKDILNVYKKDIYAFIKKINKGYFSGEDGALVADSLAMILTDIAKNEKKHDKFINESVVNEKTSFSQMKKDSKTKEYKEVSNAIEGAQEISDIWNMLDPKMFKFSESEFDNIFQGWWNNQMSYDSVEDFGRNASWEDAHSLYLHLLPHAK